MRVIKVGGNELKDEQFLTGLASAIAKMDESVVIVHGGGQAIADMQMALGLPIEKVDGLRVTSEAAMNVTEMVLSGHTNKLLVRALLAADVNAIGLSGVDGGLLMARKKVHDSADLGYVGTVMSVNTLILELLLAEGFTPVISPVSLGLDNHAYNVNADEAATAIAAALEADQLDFISNVPGVLQDNVLVHQLTNKQTKKLITEGVIFGGMLPKVRAALNSVEQGVTQVRIVNLAGLNSARAESHSKGKRFYGPKGQDESAKYAVLFEENMDNNAIIQAEADNIVSDVLRPKPIFTHGNGAYLYDSDGNKYLDFVAGIAVMALGHSDPEWVAAINAQAGQLTHVSNLYYTAPQVELAQKLVATSFADKVYFCNSGAEANESAIKFARKYARVVHGRDDKTNIVAFSGSFHGRTMGALAVTLRDKYQKAFEPLMPGVVRRSLMISFRPKMPARQARRVL